MSRRTGLDPTFHQRLGAALAPLRDEGVHYADKLAAAGVETAHVCYDGMIHGFFSMAGWLEKSREALDYAAERLGEALTKAKPL